MRLKKFLSACNAMSEISARLSSRRQFALQRTGLKSQRRDIRAQAIGLAALAMLVLAAQVCFCQNPEILKVEPPGWWAGHSINPVRVLIRGKNLTGGRVQAGAGVHPGPAKVNDAGTYLFVDLTIALQAKPGPRSLKITTPHGAAEASFEIYAPLGIGGRFQGFTNDDVIYLIMTDRFSDGDSSNDDPPQSRGLYDRSKSRYYHGGDFEGIIQHLPYLKELGVTAIWLTPWYDNVNHLNEREQYPDRPNGPRRMITDYHGYGAVDFYGVEEHFGTLAKLRELVDRAHRLGIKVIQDEVANHTGPYHPWVKDPPTATWFNGSEAKHLANVWQTWSVRDPHSSYQVQRETLEGWFVNILPDLNQDDPECARYLIQNTLWWIGVTGIDAIRQDTFQYVPRTFWRDWMTAIKRQYPKVNVVGEVLDGDVAHTSFFQGGRAAYDGIDDRLDTLFDFPLMYAIRHAFAEGRDIREVPRILASDRLYANAQILVPLIGNHDLKRFMSEADATLAGLKMAQTLVMTVRGTPQLYYGDEIAMSGGDDPDNRQDFPGGFPADGIDAFHTRNAKQQTVFEHQKLLGQLRAQLAPLRHGKLINLVATEHQYVYARSIANDSVIVAFNNDHKPATLQFNVADINLADGVLLRDRLGNVKDSRVVNAAVRFDIPAQSSAVLVRQ